KGFYTIKNELESLIGKSIYRVLPDVEKSIYKNMEC
ncbi:HD domain-containing protein, partial [Bacillus cereus group sp. Bce025]